MNIVFAGTPAFAVPALRALHTADHYPIRAVYTQPDRPAGRGRRPTGSAIKQTALEMGLAVYQPERFTPAEVSRLAQLQPDVLIVVAYGLLLSKAVLTTPRYGCINVHASLLPRWRGAAPIARAIEAGDRITGITIMQMDEGLDTGDILAQLEMVIEDSDTARTLHDRLATAGAGLLLETLGQLQRGDLKRKSQNEAGACYARKLSKEEATLDWTQSAVSLHRKIRALNPWPVASTRFRGRLLRIWEPGSVEFASAPAHSTPGMVVTADRHGIRVMSGEGILAIRRLQLEGGKPMAAAAFVNGHRLRPGERLG